MDDQGAARGRPGRGLVTVYLNSFNGELADCANMEIGSPSGWYPMPCDDGSNTYEVVCSLKTAA